VRYSVPTYATAGGRPLSDTFCETAIFSPRSLMVALLVALAGCAAPGHPPDLTPPVRVSERTWLLVDSDIGAASTAAKESARNYARGPMEKWRNLVHERTEADFIPWFTGYWTQQWLAIKVAWFKLSAEKGTDPAVKRLAAYLQEQYHDRVLAPVAKEIDPDLVREQATKLYVQFLGKQLQGIPQRYGVPSDQFDQRIRGVPAIALSPHPAQSASLYQIAHADPITKLPAYVALIAQIRKDAGGAGVEPSDTRISPVAERASKEMEAKLATSGGASAAAAVVGGVPGMIISMGAVGFGAIEHENERPKMEAQLRENLTPVLDDMWRNMMEDPVTGVMAGVHHISEQIKGGLAKTLTQPVKFGPLPLGNPLPGEQPFKDDKQSGDGGLSDNADVSGEERRTELDELAEHILNR